MGFVDNVVQTESTKSMSLSNSSHFEGKSGRLLMENGHCAPRAGLPKYKRRRISAVRHFPPGCGRFAPRIFSGSDEAAVCAGGNVAWDDCPGPSGTKHDSKSLGGSQSLVLAPILEKNIHIESEGQEPAVTSGEVNGLKSVTAEPAGFLLPESVGASNDARVIEPAEYLESGVVHVSNDLSKVGVTALAEKVVLQKYPPRRRISAVRDFPPFCGRNAPRLGKEAYPEVLISTENKNLDQEDSSVKQMGDAVQDRDDYWCTWERIVSRPTVDKVQSNSEELATKEMRNQHDLGAFTQNEITAVQSDIQERNVKSPKASNQNQLDRKPKVVPKSVNRGTGGSEENLEKELVVHMEEKGSEGQLSDLSGGENEMLHLKDFESLEYTSDRIIVFGLVAQANSALAKSKGANKPNNLASCTGESEGRKLVEWPRSTIRAKKSAENLGGRSKKMNSAHSGKAYQGIGQTSSVDEDYLESGGKHNNFQLVWRPNNYDVTIPPSRLVSSSSKAHCNDAMVTRNKVRETLRLFHAVCRKLLHEEEAKQKDQRNAHFRVDLQASKILKEKNMYVNEYKIIGPVPGVEVGDEFQYRVELNVIGLHRPIQGGIDFVKQGGNILATSIVASGGYDDDTDSSDVLIYTGSGGNMSGGKEPEDQKLERGNLALKNSMDAKNPVRVIRGDTKVSDSSDAKAKTYIYDGLYIVEKYWQEMGHHGKLVYKFRLGRVAGQPELSWKVVKKSKKFKVREGLYVDDISQGRERIPICAVNNIDDEKPPVFEYVTHMIYPDWYRLLTPKGCDCTNGCSESGKCSCVMKNGGEIPYNHNGAIVEMKSLVFECGPNCRCPPSCYNRVSQLGIKFQLEIFKTELRGWGVRSLNSIPSGSFICEYIGEILEEKEAEERTGNDEYLFDIGNQYNESSLWDGLSTLMPEAKSTYPEVVENGSFTIDAAQCGNVGRFINHSCSPNLYAQNVLYDHLDKRIPHIMLFAAENIPPLQELTYHYNYMIDEVFDSGGNIKKKSCYCGSSECTGRMY